jgi:cytoskeletal protein CcmA (bactofilin family)
VSPVGPIKFNPRVIRGARDSIRLATGPVYTAGQTYYIPRSTVLSGLLYNHPGHVATEFRFGGIVMWRKPEDSKPSSPVAEVPPVPQRVDPPARSVAGLTAEVVQPSGGMVTSTLIIKGEISGREDLYIDGEVQGTIRLSEGRVTIGPHGKISADVDAREIVVRGKVTGSIRARERVEVGRTGEIRGDIATARIAIEEGAQMHSKVEITRAEDSRNARPVAKSAAIVPTVPQPVAVKAAGEAAN